MIDLGPWVGVHITALPSASPVFSQAGRCIEKALEMSLTVLMKAKRGEPPVAQRGAADSFVNLSIFLHAGVNTPQSFCSKAGDPKALDVSTGQTDVLNMKYCPEKKSFS